MKNHVPFYLLISFILIGNKALSWTTVNNDLSSDSLALLDLYESANGLNWTNSWDLTQPVSTWHGVSVVNGRVTVLQLNNNALKGSLPSSIGNLTELQLLLMHTNELTGTIPIEVGQLTKLTWLDLHNNQLSGEIPTTISQIFTLKSLNLDNNQLTGSIPQELSALQNLTSINLAINQLSGSLPNSLGQLKNLRGLILFNNSFEGSIPSLWGDMTSLVELWINDNSGISGAIPIELTNLNLERFYFTSTSICELDTESYKSWKENIPEFFGTNTLCNVETDFTSFNIDNLNHRSLINSEDHVVNLILIANSLPYETDLSNLSVSFTVSDNASVFLEDTLIENGKTSIDLNELVEFIVVAEDGITTQDWTIAYDIILSVDEEYESLVIFPNPTEDLLFISDGNYSRVEIFDLHGKMVLNKNVSSKIRSIDLSDLNSGIYSLRLHSYDKVSHHKLIVR